MTNNVVGSIDLVEILFTLFWLFFAVLIMYLHRESKREGYPLLSSRNDGVVVRGFPDLPPPKTYKPAHGEAVTVPRTVDEYELKAKPAGAGFGSPFVPTGDPLVDGVGPAAWSERAETPDLTLHGKPRIVPMRSQPAWHVDDRDPDPRGMDVIAADGEKVGSITDVWVDIPEPMIVYLEVALDASIGSGQILVPFHWANVNKSAGQIEVDALLSAQFANVPRLATPDTITLREEDKLMGYFGGGGLLAEPSRSEPLL